MAIYQKAAHQILDDLDVADSYAHAGNKLLAGLADRADAIACQRESQRKSSAPVDCPSCRGMGWKETPKGLIKCNHGEDKSYLEAPRGPLTGKELEEHEEKMAKVREEIFGGSGARHTQDCPACRGTGWKDSGNGKFIACRGAQPLAATA